MIAVQLSDLKNIFRKPPSIDKQQWLQIAAKAIQTISERVEQGRGVDDRKMKPLNPRYAAKKKKLGQPGVRNMMFSGAMLGALQVVGVTDKSVMIGFTRRSEVVKAQANQNRDAWFGISRKDEDVITRFAAKLLRSK